MCWQRRVGFRRFPGGQSGLRQGEKVGCGGAGGGVSTGEAAKGGKDIISPAFQAHLRYPETKESLF